MIKIFKISVILTFFIFTHVSCISTKRATELFQDDQPALDFEKGSFRNCPESNCGHYKNTLSDQLIFQLFNKDSIENWSNTEVDLKRNNKSLEISVVSDDSIVKSWSLRGKWKGNIFRSKTMIRPIGLPFIYFWYYDKRVFIKWTEDYMEILNIETKFGMIFILNAGNTSSRLTKFRRIK